jgi:hypothetical protein
VQHADVKIALVVVSIAAAVAALSACSPIADTNYHGTVSGNAAPTPISTVSTPSVPAVPVTISGSDEQVKTADLVAGGYTVAYQATSNCIDAVPVHADGTEGGTVLGGCGAGSDPASGTAVYHATGRTTFHVLNTHGSWSLTFNPLS